MEIHEHDAVGIVEPWHRRRVISVTCVAQRLARQRDIKILGVTIDAGAQATDTTTDLPQVFAVFFLAADADEANAFWQQLTDATLDIVSAPPPDDARHPEAQLATAIEWRT